MSVPGRRTPPPFRRVAVREIDWVTPALVRVTFVGDDLAGMPAPLPAASVRVLFPPEGHDDVVMPDWAGNEFLLPGGSRPWIRTFTPRRFEPAGGELDLEIVVHARGVATDWVRTATPGARAAVSGPGRGWTYDDEAQSFLLAGDESALPAMSQLLEVLPANRPVTVHVEVSRPDARRPLPPHPAATVHWWDADAGATPGDALVRAVAGVPITPEMQLWVAGEAAAVQRIRTILFADRGLSRTRATVRGYWKHGRAGDTDDE